jgi:hypothetical protein
VCLPKWLTIDSRRGRLAVDEHKLVIELVDQNNLVSLFIVIVRPLYIQFAGLECQDKRAISAMSFNSLFPI